MLIFQNEKFRRVSCFLVCPLLLSSRIPTDWWKVRFNRCSRQKENADDKNRGQKREEGGARQKKLVSWLLPTFHTYNGVNSSRVLVTSPMGVAESAELACLLCYIVGGFSCREEEYAYIHVGTQVVCCSTIPLPMHGCLLPARLRDTKRPPSLQSLIVWRKDPPSSSSSFWSA